MKIGVLGTGVVGQMIAEKLESLGHDVQIGTRNVEQTIARSENDAFGRPPFSKWHESHPTIKPATFNEAGAFGEFVVNATNGKGTLDALATAGAKNLAGKVLLDISNPLDFSKGMPPSLLVSNTDSLGEQIQRVYPDTKVVKCLNTMNAYLMVKPDILPDDHTAFICGNDTTAKQKVLELLVSFGWKARNIIDLGDISCARGTEQYLPLWTRIWMSTQNPMFNIKVVLGNLPTH